MRSAGGCSVDEYVSIETGTVADWLVWVVLLLSRHTSIACYGTNAEVRGGSSQSLGGVIVALITLGILTRFRFVLFWLLVVRVVGLPGHNQLADILDEGRRSEEVVHRREDFTFQLELFFLCCAPNLYTTLGKWSSWSRKRYSGWCWW